MPGTRNRFIALVGFALSAAPSVSFARDLKITIPRHSELTPVQRLNREGVDAVLKHQYEKAEGFFYKAYLYDPVDPFTLTNLGYVSELHGQLDRAEKFYKLAAEQSCNAIIDRTDTKQLEGKPMMYALGTSKDTPMRVNRINVLGIELLSQDRGFEAASLLEQALTLDPRNSFTLNNLGVAAESVGDLETALKYYDQAAALRASEQVVITPKRSWRGKPVSELAAESARTLRKRMETIDLPRARAAMLAIRGVSAINRNDWGAARQDFLAAFPLDPQGAFTLNNRAYVAERDGDPETAKLFYSAAQQADDAGARVGSATQSSAQGQHLDTIANESSGKVGGEIDAYVQNRRLQNAPVELKRRDGRPIQPETSSPKPPSDVPPADSPAQQPPQ